jgi:hypothetical protein
VNAVCTTTAYPNSAHAERGGLSRRTEMRRSGSHEKTGDGAWVPTLSITALRVGARLLGVLWFIVVVLGFGFALFLVVAGKAIISFCREEHSSGRHSPGGIDIWLGNVGQRRDDTDE